MYSVDPLFAEVLFCDDIGHKFIVGFGVMADAGFQRDVFLDKLQHRQVAAVGDDVIEQIVLDLLLLFPQGQLTLLPSWSAVVFIQPPAVHEFDLAVIVLILKLVTSVRTLALSEAQYAITIVASFFAQLITLLS